MFNQTYIALMVRLSIGGGDFAVEAARRPGSNTLERIAKESAKNKKRSKKAK